MMDEGDACTVNPVVGNRTDKKDKLRLRLHVDTQKKVLHTGPQDFESSKV